MYFSDLVSRNTQNIAHILEVYKSFPLDKVFLNISDGVSQGELLTTQTLNWIL